ncbi:MAG TPA: hypothetical protein V6C58_01235 [Allocoleopsis sp.]
MNNRNFQAMNRQELHNYVFNHRDDQEAFYAYMDKLHNEAKWVEMPPLQSVEDLDNYPDFVAHVSNNLLSQNIEKL